MPASRNDDRVKQQYVWDAVVSRWLISPFFASFRVTSRSRSCYTELWITGNREILRIA